MKDYLMLNKIKLTFSLIKIRIEDFFHPNMSFTINDNTYNRIEKNPNTDILYSHINAKMHLEFMIPHIKSEEQTVKDSMLLIHNINEPIRKTFVIPIGDINKNEVNMYSNLISDYKSEIEWDEHSGEIFFQSNKKEELN